MSEISQENPPIDTNPETKQKVRLGFAPRFLPSIRDPKRNQLIDILRGLAIALVVCSHLQVLDPLIRPHVSKFFGRDIGNISNGMGYYGVAVFFCISGFLITSGILKRSGKLSHIKPTDFWWLRFSRIMPLFALCMLTMVSYHYFKIPVFHYKTETALWRDFTAAFSFHYNSVFGGEEQSHVWNPMWSLSVEEMFYFVLPFICLAIDGAAAAFWVGMTLIFTSIYFRITGAAGPFSTWGCVDLLALGCLMAIAQPAQWRTRWPRPIVRVIGWFCGLSGYGLIAYAIVREHPFDNPTYSSLICGAGACLALISTQLLIVPSWLRIPLFPFSALGVISYEVYLIHMPITDGLISMSDTKWTFVLISLVLGILIHEIFSEPMNVALRRLPREVKPGSRKLLVGIALRTVLGISAVMGGAYIFYNAGKPGSARFTLSKIPSLPAGAHEPIVYVGRRGEADLLYLEHEADGKVKLGFDHWGGHLCLTEPLLPQSIENKVFRVIFGFEKLQLFCEGREILVYSGSAHRSGRAVLGKNDIGFSSEPAQAETVVTLAR